MANDLDIPQLVEGQASPEVTTNDATAALGDAMANKFDVDLSAGNATLTEAQYRSAVLFNATGVATTGRTVTLPAVEREFALVLSDTANTNDISLIVGSTTITLHPGRLYLISTDGTTDGLVAHDIGGDSNAAADFSIFVPGVMVDAQLLFRRKATRAFNLPTNLSGSFVTCVTAATGSTTITFKKAGASIGTAVFSGAGTTAALTLTATAFAVGDVLTIEGPATADATAANFSIDVKASR